jgi:preprotein translocase subunit SecG
LSPFYLPIADISQYVFGPIIFILSLFMVLLILVQRGRGGGLVGALGGAGGQSAFGTKAGDLFTRITVVTAGIWIFLLGFTVWWYTPKKLGSVLPSTAATSVSSGSMSSGSTSTDAAPALDAPTTEKPSDVPVTAEAVDLKDFLDGKPEMKDAAADKPVDKPSEPSSETTKPAAESDKPAVEPEKPAPVEPPNEPTAPAESSEKK